MIIYKTDPTKIWHRRLHFAILWHCDQIAGKIISEWKEWVEPCLEGPWFTSIIMKWCQTSLQGELQPLTPHKIPWTTKVPSSLPEDRPCLLLCPLPGRFSTWPCSSSGSSVPVQMARSAFTTSSMGTVWRWWKPMAEVIPCYPSLLTATGGWSELWTILFGWFCLLWDTSPGLSGSKAGLRLEENRWSHGRLSGLCTKLSSQGSHHSWFVLDVWATHAVSAAWLSCRDHSSDMGSPCLLPEPALTVPELHQLSLQPHFRCSNVGEAGKGRGKGSHVPWDSAEQVNLQKPELGLD